MVGLMDGWQCVLPFLNSSLLTSSRSFSVQEALATIGEKLCFDLDHCLSQHSYSPFSADRKSILRGQISATIQPDNTVRKLMGKNSIGTDSLNGLDIKTNATNSFPRVSDSRIQSYLLSSLRPSQHKSPTHLPGGLLHVAKELREFAVRFTHLVNFNKLVFSPFYQKILHKILTEGLSP